MKSTFKTCLILISAAVLLNASCKKSTDAIINKTTVSSADVAKQVAFDFYRSLSSGIGSANGGLKTGSTSTLKMMDSQTPCGSTVYTPTHTTTKIGDTTRVYDAHQTFMYMCDGYFNNGYTVDAYVQKDTLTTTETGTNFKNVYGITLFYSVKAADANYTKLTFDGYTSTSFLNTKLSGTTVTESHYMRTAYNWTAINAQRTATSKPIFLSGRVDYDTHVDNLVNGNTTNDGYAGFMEFLSGNMMRITLYVLGGNNKVYLLNLTTGVMTAV